MSMLAEDEPYFVLVSPDGEDSSVDDENTADLSGKNDDTGGE